MVCQVLCAGTRRLKFRGGGYMTDELLVKADKIAEQSATGIYARISNHKITDEDSYVLMGELVKEVKKIVNKFEEETRPEIEQAYKLHKALIARKKKWSDKFEEAEKLGKDKLKHYESMNEVPQIEGIIFTETWDGDVVDEALIPAEYRIPDITKLKSLTKALKQEMRVPGWQVRPVKTVAVRG